MMKNILLTQSYYTIKQCLTEEFKVLDSFVKYEDENNKQFWLIVFSF